MGSDDEVTADAPGRPMQRLVGRWKQDEIKRLYRAVELHGRDWKAVTEVVGTRSRQDCQNKTWKEVTAGRMREPPGKQKQVRWTEEELELLKSSVARFGRNWVQISNVLGTKTAQECQDKITTEVRARRMQEPGVKRKQEPWTPVEKAKLREAVNVYGRNWAQVAQCVGRTRKECARKVETEVNAGRMPELVGKQKHIKWTENEVKLLHEAVSLHGRNWANISAHVVTKSPRECAQKILTEVRAGRLKKELAGENDNENNNGIVTLEDIMAHASEKIADGEASPSKPVTGASATSREGEGDSEKHDPQDQKRKKRRPPGSGGDEAAGEGPTAAARASRSKSKDADSWTATELACATALASAAGDNQSSGKDGKKEAGSKSSKTDAAASSTTSSSSSSSSSTAAKAKEQKEGEEEKDELAIAPKIKKKERSPNDVLDSDQASTTVEKTAGTVEETASDVKIAESSSAMDVDSKPAPVYEVGLDDLDAVGPIEAGSVGNKRQSGTEPSRSVRPRKGSTDQD